MKVTLLGDSIRQQYTPLVKELLGEEFDVWTPEQNCMFAQYTLRGLFDWASNMEGSDIVHWNNGHWDVCRLFGDGTFSDEEDYVKNILRIAHILQKRYGTVIFATTTPVRSLNQYNKNEDIDRFNQRVVSLLRECGVIINDLNGLLRPDVERYICEDNIHLSDEGIALCAAQVASSIKAAAENTMHVSEPKENVLREDTVNNLGAPVLLP